MNKDSSTCVVCDLAVSADWTAHCQECGGLYHFRQREDLAGDDCGEAWLNTEFLALEFACATCLAEARGAGGLESVVTAAEAAGLAGVSEAEIVAIAQAGELIHREAGGVLLFERAEVLRYVRDRGA